MTSNRDLLEKKMPKARRSSICLISDAIAKIFTQSPEQSLLDAAKSGRLDKIQSAILNGANLEVKDIVSTQSIYRYVLMQILFLRWNFCRNYECSPIFSWFHYHYQSNQDGNTALCLAVTNGFQSIVTYLIKEKNVDVNTSNNVSEQCIVDTIPRDMLNPPFM